MATASADIAAEPGITAGGGKGLRKDPPKATFHLNKDTRLKAKREAFEKERLLTLRTGSLHSFLGPCVLVGIFGDG